MLRKTVNAFYDFVMDDKKYKRTIRIMGEIIAGAVVVFVILAIGIIFYHGGWDW